MSYRAIFKTKDKTTTKTYKSFSKSLKTAIKGFIEKDLINNNVTVYSSEDVENYDNKNYQDLN